MRRVLVIAAISVLGAVGASAQQEKGDKEVGIGGQLYLMSNSGSTSGNASFQFSFGYFFTGKNYFGFEADPSLSIGGGSTTASGFFGGNYRHLLGNSKGRAFFFLGAGGGAYTQGGSGGGSSFNYGVAYPEVGVKSYISQKTSLEVAYKMLYDVNTPGGGKTSFSDRIHNQATISIRHIF